jgi:energy-coupling factor transporter ATP-binding protein EcfA2
LVINYFIRDTEICKSLGLDLEKGIFFSGLSGCCKTALMKSMRYIVPHQPRYEFIPCRNIVFGFNQLGHKVIEDYGNEKRNCFDDLGLEPMGNHFNMESYVKGELLVSRYERRIRIPPFTFWKLWVCFCGRCFFVESECIQTS